MTRRTIDLRRVHPELELVSHGRGGPRVPHALREHIARTVGHVPEVVVRVSGGGSEVGAVKAHLRYIGRHGRLSLITDDGQQVTTMTEVNRLLQEWGLALEEREGRRRYSGVPGRKGPKLVHNIIFSMPAGSSPKKVLAAVQRMALEQWALEHRYLMALHTDTGRPHVHLVLKAVSERGKRLNIRKETLRHWRQEFAKHLRAQGVAANATSRVIRGQPRPAKRDGEYRARRRGDSTVLRKHIEEVAAELAKRGHFVDPVGECLRQTRRQTQHDWIGLAEALDRDGDRELGADVRRFVDRMPPPRTEREEIAEQLRSRLDRGRGDTIGSQKT